MTPFHYAARNGYLDICKVIIKCAQNKNPANLYGWTPLHFAAQDGHLDICKLIIDKVENKNPADNFGKTPKDLAKGRKNGWKIVQLFESYNI